jgi:hypothetical protein
MYTGTYERLNVTVFASNRTVIKAASRKINHKHRFGRAKREARRAFYREILAAHEAARALVQHFRL